MDALWMGVPVVTLAGRTGVGRGGVSILSNVGLPELIARTPEQYVDIAIGLAEDRARLSELRSGLRQRMEVVAADERQAVRRKRRSRVSADVAHLVRLMTQVTIEERISREDLGREDREYQMLVTGIGGSFRVDDRRLCESP